MKVFISWSGEKSRLVALALREWLPWVVNDIKPFVSDEDIHSGTRWESEVAGELEATNFGIICVTKENQDARWLNFEAGALAKAVDASRVIPLAIDLKLSDLALPLGQFQAQLATQDGLRKVLSALNAACDHPLEEERLRKAADKWWSDLEELLAQIEEKTKADAAEPQSAERTDRELLEETLDTVRSLARDLETTRRVVRRRQPEAEAFAEELRMAVDDLGVEAEIIAPPSASGLFAISPQATIPSEAKDKLWGIARAHGVKLGFFESPDERAERLRTEAEVGDA